MTRFYLALLPWAVFDVVLRSRGLGVLWGSMIALATAVGVLASERSRAVGILQLVAVPVFTALCIAAAVGAGPMLRPYARSIVIAVLAIACATSVLSEPCTTRFSRQLVARHHWSEPEFHRFNMRYSIVWAVAFLAVGASELIGTELGSPLATTVCNWLVPIGLALGVGLSMSRSMARLFDENEPTVREVLESLGRIYPMGRNEALSRRRFLHLHRG